MPSPSRSLGSAIGAVAVLLAIRPAVGVAQRPGMPPSVASADSVTIAPGAHYKAGGFHRFLLGGAYRDLWTTPLRVPVLNLRTFAGGLRPDKEGGGQQTKSLHLVNPDGVEYVFRSVDKDNVVVPEMWKGTVVHSIALDGVSNSHPAASLVAARMLEAAGVLHVTPVLVVMPDDSALGKFRKTYAGRLGGIEEDPARGKHGNPGFAGASDDHRKRLAPGPPGSRPSRAYRRSRVPHRAADGHAAQRLGPRTQSMEVGEV